MSSACALLFLKAPQPGRVKTRLAARIGPDRAADLYRCFGLDFAERVRAWAIARKAAVRVLYAPPSERAAIADWLGDCADPPASLHPQVSGDLGDRLRAGFEAAFAAGCDRAVALGGDSPDWPTDWLDRAIAALDAADCAIAPATDGGYCAIAFSRQGFCPAVFDNMPWSTAAVCEKTLAVLAAGDRRTVRLPTWSDADELADLRALWDRLAATPDDPAPRTRNYLDGHRVEWFGP